MNPRGVTLVELLAAISIMVVVTALALPALQNRMSAARLDAAEGQLQAAALVARADAMRQGRSLSLTAHLSRAGEMDLVIAPLTPSDAAAGTGSATSSDAASRGLSAGSSWATLPTGIKIDQQPPASSDRSNQAIKDTGGETRDVRIAVFCPDGSAVTSPVYLTDGDSVLVVTVNPWIGGVKFAAFVAERRDATGAETGDGKSSDPGDGGARPKPPTIKSPAAPPAKGGTR